MNTSLINKLTKIILCIFVFVLMPAPKQAIARSVITDWYIKDMHSDIIVNEDSSLLITETIIADCGNLPDKHGIFRILPTIYKSGLKATKTPVELISIEDVYGTRLPFTTINDSLNHTTTWKIGDPDVTVTGENSYVITYLVKNTIRFTNESFDEFYWNLSGNYWDIEIDSFSSTIYFPNSITKENAKLNLYSGKKDENTNMYSTYKWEDDNTLTISSTKTLPVRTGITASVTFPKNIIKPYEITFIEQYGEYLFLMLPFFSIIICLLVWRKYGKDPVINPTIAPEFEIPENFSPIEMGMIYTDGIMKKEFISASIIRLAVKKLIKIDEIEPQGLFESKDFKLSLISKDFSKLNIIEIVLINKLFGDDKKEITISSQKNKFYKKVEEISKQVKEDLYKKNLLLKSSRVLQAIFIGVSVFLFFFGVGIGSVSIFGSIGMMVSAVIFFIFSFFMTKRNIEGAEMKRRIEGFKLYLQTAERYRQKFNEKENIFDEFLPYAIMFNMTKEWIKKMKIMYGEEKFNSYAPYWYTSFSSGAFDANTFTDSIQSLSSEIASDLSSSPSGSGGVGASGGGGGGGGGGGW